MFAYDDDTGELTRDGRPVSGQLQRLFDLLRYDAEEFEQVLDQQWWEHDVPGSDETLWLPQSRGEIFDEWVEELAVAYRSADSFGPMTSDGWQRICRVDDIYFILDGGGGGFDVRVIGVDAYDEALAAADAFIEGDDGSALSIWDDEDDPEPEDMTWCADDDDDDDDDEDEDDYLSEDERAQIAEARVWQQRLWDTVITHDATGVVLAGRGGSSPLPGPGSWFVVPVPAERIDELAETLGGQPVTVVDEGLEIEALLTQDLRVSSATRLAGSFGYGVCWELTADEVRLISCDPYIVAANALRDMP